MSLTIRCHHCGVEVPEASRFCGQCGAHIDTPHVQGGLRSARVGVEPDDDRPLWVGHVSWRAHVPCFALALAAAVAWYVALPTFPANPDQPSRLAAMWYGWLAIAVAVYVYWLYRRRNDSYTLTARRITYRHGILSRATHFTEIIDVDDVGVDQAFWERLLGIGTIRIASSDDSHPWLTIAGIYPVQQVAELIDATRHRERVARGLHVEVI